MLEGVTIVNPAATVIDVAVEIGEDSVIAPFSSLHGATEIGNESTIGPLSTLIDSRVGNGACRAGFTRGFLCTVFVSSVWGQAGCATISLRRLQPCNFGCRSSCD